MSCSVTKLDIREKNSGDIDLGKNGKNLARINLDLKKIRTLKDLKKYENFGEIKRNQEKSNIFATGRVTHKTPSMCIGLIETQILALKNYISQVQKHVSNTQAWLPHFFG